MTRVQTEANFNALEAKISAEEVRLRRIIERRAVKIDEAQEKAKNSKQILGSWNIRIFDICEKALESGTDVSGLEVLSEKMQHEINVQMAEAARVRLARKNEIISPKVNACFQERKKLQQAQSLAKYIEAGISLETALIELSKSDANLNANLLNQYRNVYEKVADGTYLPNSI